MKKHSLAEFFKSKGFYGLLCVGALAIIAITMVSMNQSSNQRGEENQNLVDLNEPIQNDQTSLDTANNETGSGTDEVAEIDKGGITNPATDGSRLEFDIYDENLLVTDVRTEDEDETQKETAEDVPSNNQEVASNTSEEDVNSADTASNETDTGGETTEPVAEVMSPETLHFDAEDGLSWPVVGNVLMNYSVDRVIYHQTLEQFRVNPAVIIDANVGDTVISAAKGIVTFVGMEDETGLTVKVDIGSGYKLVYGQLQDVTVKEGDTILEGDTLGSIANPSKYYSVEGSNLYFQVMKDDETVNPMLLLK